MTNANGNQNVTSLILANVELDIRQLYTRNQEAWDFGEMAFPNFGERLMVFSRDLEGVPFAFLSGTEEVHLPERKLPDGRKFAAQDGLRVFVSIFDISSKVQAFGPPREAQLTDQYLVNQLRGADDVQLVGSGLWTIARNTDFTTQGGQSPRMLTRYRVGIHKPPTAAPRTTVEESVWDGGNTTESDTFREIREAQQRGERRATATIEKVTASKNKAVTARQPDKPTANVLAQAEAMREAMNRQANTDEILPWENAATPETPVKRGRGRPRKIQ